MGKRRVYRKGEIMYAYEYEYKKSPNYTQGRRATSSGRYGILCALSDWQTTLGCQFGYRPLRGLGDV